MLIFEPCKTASNFAYYHMVTGMARKRRWKLEPAVVRGLAQSAAALCLGSAAFHGSHTRLGRRADNNVIGIMSYILHQASTAHLPAQLRTVVITDLSLGEATLDVLSSAGQTDISSSEETERGGGGPADH